MPQAHSSDVIRRPRLLLDVRETEAVRGFHVMAAAHLLSEDLAGCDLHFLCSENSDERVAVDAFCFDTGLQMTPWSPENGSLGQEFDLYAAIFDADMPDIVADAARRHSRQTLLGFCFPVEDHGRDATIADGNDTVGFARLMKQMLAIN